MRTFNTLYTPGMLGLQDYTVDSPTGFNAVSIPNTGMSVPQRESATALNNLIRYHRYITTELPQSLEGFKSNVRDIMERDVSPTYTDLSPNDYKEKIYYNITYYKDRFQTIGDYIKSMGQLMQNIERNYQKTHADLETFNSEMMRYLNNTMFDQSNVSRFGSIHNPTVRQSFINRTRKNPIMMDTFMRNQLNMPAQKIERIEMASEDKYGGRRRRRHSKRRRTYRK